MPVALDQADKDATLGMDDKVRLTLLSFGMPYLSWA
jgi:hypothetical protein